MIFWQEEGEDPLIQRNVTVFADGEVDRSPCGSGTSARLALLHDEGRLATGEPLLHRSIVGTSSPGGSSRRPPQGVITEVEGSAHLTGRHEFVLEPERRSRRGVPAAVRRIGALVAIAVVAAGCASYPHHVSFATIDADPAWSPDGRFVAFASSRLGGGIYVVRQDGSGLRRLIPGAVSDVVWSPDGRRLAYLGRGGLYVASANGDGRSRILGRRYSSPAWSPDGRSIAVAG